MSKLTNEQRELRDYVIEVLFEDGHRCSQIAERFGMSVDRVRQIIVGRGHQIDFRGLGPTNTIWELSEEERRSAIWARARAGAAEARMQGAANA